VWIGWSVCPLNGWTVNSVLSVWPPAFAGARVCPPACAGAGSSRLVRLTVLSVCPFSQFDGHHPPPTVARALTVRVIPHWIRNPLSMMDSCWSLSRSKCGTGMTSFARYGKRGYDLRRMDSRSRHAGMTRSERYYPKLCINGRQFVRF